MTDSSAALLEVAATVDPARPATSARRGRKRRGPDDSRRGIVWRVIVAVVVSAIVIFPLYWMCVVAFSPRGEVFEPGLHLIPSTFTLENFQNVLSQYPVFTWFGNSVVIGVFVTVFTGFRYIFVRVPWQPLYLAIFAAFVGTVGESFIIDTDHWRHFWLMLGTMWGMFVAAERWKRQGMVPYGV